VNFTGLRLFVAFATVASSAQALPALARQASQDTTQTAPKAESPAEAARRAREEKKSPPKPARVWDNDNLPKEGEGVNVVGTTETAAPPPAAAQPAPGLSTQEKAQLEAARTSLKEKIAALSQELDIAQRKYTLDSDMYYGKTNYQQDTPGKAALDAEASAVKDKKQQLDEAKAQLAALETKLNSPKEQKKD